VCRIHSLGSKNTSKQNSTGGIIMTSETRSVSKSAFSKTVLKNMELSLASAYGKEKAAEIFEQASSILNYELINMDDRGNKTVRKHLRDFILPGFACYKALQETGFHAGEAFEFVSKEIYKTAKEMGNTMRKFKNLPFAYGLMRLFARPIMKYGFPKEGWTIYWKENNSKRISFDMTSCLYCEELKKRNAFELCIAFCESDHLSYDPLSPKIVFKRSGTIAYGNKVCDFCFKKESIKTIWKYNLSSITKINNS
jgi:hypothetical protein